MGVFDVHTHPVLYGRGGSKAEIDSLVRLGRLLNIEGMVALGDVLVHERTYTAAQIRAVNDQTAQIQRWHPDYFVGFCFLNPTLGEREVGREVDRCVDRYDFRGIKLEICNNARDACMRPVMEAARRHGLPVLQHTWSQTKLRERRWHTDPADVAILARRHPDVRIIMPHLSGVGVRGVLEVLPCANVWVDTSGGVPEEGLIEYALEKLGVDRLMYGSDLPGRSPAVAIGRVLGASMSERDRQAVLAGNARRLLGVKEKAR
jgi:predicted TIM-barrel fold metal-dependent hydrolase